MKLGVILTMLKTGTFMCFCLFRFNNLIYNRSILLRLLPHIIVVSFFSIGFD